MGECGNGSDEGREHGEPAQAAAADHWRWRPEWGADRPCAFWYLTVDAARVSARVHAASESLAAVPWVDRVPPRWWHVTLCEVGYVEQVGRAILARVRGEVADRARRRPLGLTLGPARLLRTAVVLDAGPADELATLQARVRETTSRVLTEAGPASRPDPETPLHPAQFRPHVSLGYANRDVAGDGVAPVLDGLAGLEGTADRLEVRDLILASVTRRARHYQWQVLGTTALDETERASV